MCMRCICAQQHNRMMGESQMEYNFGSGVLYDYIIIWMLGWYVQLRNTITQIKNNQHTCIHTLLPLISKFLICKFVKYYLFVWMLGWYAWLLRCK